MNETKKLLQDTMTCIDLTTELLYQRKEKASDLDQMLITTENCISRLIISKLVSVDQAIILILGDAMRAFQENDKILFADIFQYDLKSELAKILDLL